MNVRGEPSKEGAEYYVKCRHRGYVMVKALTDAGFLRVVASGRLSVDQIIRPSVYSSMLYRMLSHRPSPKITASGKSQIGLCSSEGQESDFHIIESFP